MSNNNQPWGRRINGWLQESAGETFRDNKWRFWFVALIGFQLLNALMTSMVFATGESLQRYMGGIILGVGVLLSWLAVAFMHYSDGDDRRLARGVSALDSLTLICVVAHFCFLVWVYGHLSTLQAAEAKYEASAEKYNERAEKVSGDNVEIARSGERISLNEKEAERLRNDTAYQTRKAIEAGARVAGPKLLKQQSSQGGVSLSTAPIELEKPEKPKESSVAFLTYWDWWIRMANFGELALAAITLIYIRNHSAKFNAWAPHNHGGVPDDRQQPRSLPTADMSQPIEGFARGSRDEQGQTDPK